MKKTLSALTLAICAIGTSQAAPIQWSGNGHWYEYVARAVDWNTAAADASSRGGYLATVTSAAENTFIAVDVAGGALAWLGGSDAGAAVNNWTWRFGEEAGDAFTYTNWNGGEPNNCCGGEDYLQINWGSTGRWNDHGGPGNAGQVNGYIVEYVPEPMTLALVMSALLAGVVTRRRRA